MSTQTMTEPTASAAPQAENNSSIKPMLFSIDQKNETAFSELFFVIFEIVDSMSCVVGAPCYMKYIT